MDKKTICMILAGTVCYSICKAIREKQEDKYWEETNRKIKEDAENLMKQVNNDMLRMKKFGDFGLS